MKTLSQVAVIEKQKYSCHPGCCGRQNSAVRLSVSNLLVGGKKPNSIYMFSNSHSDFRIFQIRIRRILEKLEESVGLFV